MIYYNLTFWLLRFLFVFRTSHMVLKAKGSLRTQHLVTAAVFGLAAFIGWIRMTSLNGPYAVLEYLLMLIVLAVYFAASFTDSARKKIAFFACTVAVVALAKLITDALFRVGGNIGSFDVAGSVSANLFMTYLTGLLLGVMALVLNRFRKSRTVLHYFIFYLLLPASQILIYLRIDSGATEAGGSALYRDPLFFVAFVVGIAANVLLLYLMIWEEQRAEEVRKKQEMRHVQELEKAHYEAVEQRLHEFLKIRHDYINQLTAAVSLIEQGHADQAAENLKLLTGKVAGSGKNPYCANGIVDAIVAEKAEICRERQIEFRADLKIGELAGISPVHLCSIFSNLLDNAIRAAGALTDGEPYVSVRAEVNGCYLTVKTVNPAEDPALKKSDRRGLGQEILRDIAATYDGDFTGGYKDGIYTAVITVKCR